MPGRDSSDVCPIHPDEQHLDGSRAKRTSGGTLRIKKPGDAGSALQTHRPCCVAGGVYWGLEYRACVTRSGASDASEQVERRSLASFEWPSAGGPTSSRRTRQRCDRGRVTPWSSWLGNASRTRYQLAKICSRDFASKCFCCPSRVITKSMHRSAGSGRDVPRSPLSVVSRPSAIASFERFDRMGLMFVSFPSLDASFETTT